jgi:hypothetical protein
VFTEKEKRATTISNNDLVLPTAAFLWNANLVVDKHK